ncbi:MAG: FAD-dependent oxidoreductase [Comamonadaceae bacterium]|nr:MAG: FAD-dependent oxidoreductase [Comamonadaceae bacterium]
MPERIDWLDDGGPGGTPYSPRFDDRYRSELGGLEQARDVFFKGCGLPAAWAKQPQWRILETGFGLGLNFLVTWQAWKDDPDRPLMLHFVSTEAFPAGAEDVLRSAAAHPSLLPLATQLSEQFWGLLPGFHRLSFDGGRVLLTLCIGDAKAALKHQHFEADSVYLDGFSPQKNPDIWDLHTMKAVARCCRAGTRIATWTIARGVRDALTQCGFVVRKTPGIPPKRDNLQGEFAPAWTPRKNSSPLDLESVNTPREPGTCLVVGAGLAGASVAASLARRGWRVTVLEAGAEPASGASGLPAGLTSPHVSPDDAPMSRLSRAGLRITLQAAQQLLKDGRDWQATGVLEHLTDQRMPLPAAWQGELSAGASAWSVPATPAQLEAAGLEPGTMALWHEKAAWIKPGKLVRGWLETPGVRWQGDRAVETLTRTQGKWQARGATGELQAEADLLVLAAAYGNVKLHAGLVTGQEAALALQPLRGQLSWRLRQAGERPETETRTQTKTQTRTGFESDVLPPFPVNGNGSLIPAVPVADGIAWMAGSSFERGESRPLLKPGDHADNMAKLAVLLPGLSSFAQQHGAQDLQSWAGVRCTTSGRLPLLGPLPLEGTEDTVWTSTGMGSRGLTFAALCGELLAARLHAEPLPIDARLAEALSPAGRVGVVKPKQG